MCIRDRATTPVKCRVEVKDGVLDWKSAGLSLAVVFERYGKNGNIGYSLVEGALTKPGAVATTWSHDSHNPVSYTHLGAPDGAPRRWI